MSEYSNLMKISLIVGIISTIVLTVNLALSSYVLYTSSFEARVSPENGEALEFAVKTDTGRPSPLGLLWRTMKDWTSSYLVGGAMAQNSTTGITISVTGSNVASQASVDYYIEARETNAQGSPYRFLEATGASVTVGGSSYDLGNETSIEEHLAAMGLSITESWTIDYYVYARAETVGAVSGETLIIEVGPVQFDSVTYTYGEVVSDFWAISTGSNDVGYVELANWFSKTETSLYVGDWSTSYPDYQAGLRYRPTIPQGAEITSAYLHIRAGTKYGTIPTVVISGEAADSAYTVNSATDFASRTRTDLNVSWAPSAWVSGQYYDTPDISCIVSEITDREGWASLNYMQLFLGDQDTGWSEQSLIYMNSYEGAVAPRLYVTYISYGASWYSLPPLSVVNLPISLDLIAILSVSAAIIFVAYSRRRDQK